MIPVRIDARPDDDGFQAKSEPAILPMPGVARRPERGPARPVDDMRVPVVPAVTLAAVIGFFGGMVGIGALQTCQVQAASGRSFSRAKSPASGRMAAL